MPIYKMKGKKDGLQKYKVRINYTDNTGKARQLDRIAYGSAEAKELEQQLLKELKEKSLPAKLTVSELFNEFVDCKRHEVRETTLDKIIRTLEVHVLSDFSKYKLDKLTASSLQSWKTRISDSDLKLSTKQSIYKHFRSFLNYAVKMEYLPRNPLLIVGNFKEPGVIEKPQDVLHYYTEEEFAKYIFIARKTAVTFLDWGYYVFFCIAYLLGMRKGEINALKWSDVDGNIIHIRRSVAQKVKGKQIVETSPKNKSSYRDLKIPPQLIVVLNEHKERQSHFTGFSDDFRVCGGHSCLSDTAIDKHNRMYANLAGLPRIRIHDFRHSHASLLANDSINIQEIARRLGHSDVKMTWNTYAHLYPREEDRALNILKRIPLI